MLRLPEPAPRPLERIISGPARRKYVLLGILWAASLLVFWEWWLRAEHNAGWRYGVMTAVLAWVTLLEVYFVFFVLRAVRSTAPDPQPGRWRVAMVTTKTPSEPFAVVRRTLEAMLSQRFPHDTWLADEDPSPETAAWCAANGVRISTRKDREDYHRKEWPRRTRCKEGNLAFFYDHWGYDDYDIVVQLDADHVPQPGYLIEMLRPFSDPGVGYVSAPSICASNAAENWAARTRLQTEGAFHGIMQAGYSNGFAPMCIGSHYAVRTRALREVGGLGPELAEDHSTTMILNAGGWRGVHAIDAIAIGDGPATVADMATQEFQWSRSLVTLMLRYSPRYLPAMPLRLRFQFLFCQMFYPLAALSLATLYAMPIVALWTDTTFANVTFPAYVGHALPSVAALVAIAYALKRDGHFRPVDAPVIAWEKMLFVPLQWPWVLWGCVMAVSDRLGGGFVDFRITPKGEAARGRLPLKVLGVYVGLALACLLTVILVEDVSRTNGFYLLALVTGLFYVAAVVVTVARHSIENGWSVPRKELVPQMGLVLALVGLTGYSFSERSAEALYTLTIGTTRLQLAEPLYAVAGAGTGTAEIHYRLKFAWN